MGIVTKDEATERGQAVVAAVNAEAMVMTIDPAEGNLQQEMEVSKGRVVCDVEATPD